MANTLEYLHLNDNKLNGRIPACLSRLEYLRTLDPCGNELIGEIPTWPSKQEALEFGVLRLAGNRLNGSIPVELCALSTLYVLDLSNNHITGNIPPCMGNISGLNHPGRDYEYAGNPGYIDTIHENSIDETVTRIAREYSTIIKYLSIIDLSSNDLVGDIPDELTKLVGLKFLNLSHNHLTGKIPENIGDMKDLMTLDLSGNKLIGRIPTNLGNLDFINQLNLSNNNLYGPIPISNHLQTFDPSSYAGNPYLCGNPLPKMCPSHDEQPHTEEQDNDEKENNGREMMWFYLVIMSGFVTGFWGVVGTLLLKKRWRHALFRLVEDASDWIYVAIMRKVSKLKQKIKWDNSDE